MSNGLRNITPEQFRAELAKPKRRKKPQDAAAYFVRAWQLDPLEGVEMETEYRFVLDRRWRFDVAFPRWRVAVEVDGRAGGKPCPTCKMSIGRHQTVVGVRRDYEKHNEAVKRGWNVFRFPATDRARAPEWVRIIKSVLIERGAADE